MVDELNLKDFLKTRSIRHEFHIVTRNVHGIMYEPVTLNDKSNICILVMHSNANYLTSDICLMAQYGYRVFCANVADQHEILDRKILDVKAVVGFLRRFQDIDKILLWGHSGGATLLTAYQKIAENGVSSCQGNEKIHKCSNALSDLPAADGIMLIDANWGNAAMTLLSVDPAVIAEDGSQSLAPALNLFQPENGFVPDASAFKPEFIERFQKAQGERFNALIDTALNRLKKLENGEAFYCDDEPFVIIGAACSFMNNKLFAQDTRLLSHTRQRWPLVHADGRVTEEIIHSVRKPENNYSFTNSFYEGALITTVRNFLAEYAVRTTSEYGYDADSMRGIDWSSTYSAPVGNVEDIKVPTLIMGMTASWEYIAAETIYEHSSSPDKHLAFVEGADHLYQTAVKCETYPGQYGDTRKTLFDYVDGWIRARF